MSNNNSQQQQGQIKTIRITRETYDRLVKLGDLSESFDSVIRKLLDCSDQSQKMRAKEGVKK